MESAFTLVHCLNCTSLNILHRQRKHPSSQNTPFSPFLPQFFFAINIPFVCYFSLIMKAFFSYTGFREHIFFASEFAYVPQDLSGPEGKVSGIWVLGLSLRRVFQTNYVIFTAKIQFHKYRVAKKSFDNIKPKFPFIFSPHNNLLISILLHQQEHLPYVHPSPAPNTPVRYFKKSKMASNPIAMHAYIDLYFT